MKTRCGTVAILLLPVALSCPWAPRSRAPTAPRTTPRVRLRLGTRRPRDPLPQARSDCAGPAGRAEDLSGTVDVALRRAGLVRERGGPARSPRPASARTRCGATSWPSGRSIRSRSGTRPLRLRCSLDVSLWKEPTRLPRESLDPDLPHRVSLDIDFRPGFSEALSVTPPSRPDLPVAAMSCPRTC